MINVERQSGVRDSIRISEDKGGWSVITKYHVMPDASCDTGGRRVVARQRNYVVSLV